MQRCLYLSLSAQCRFLGDELKLTTSYINLNLSLYVQLDWCFHGRTLIE